MLTIDEYMLASIIMRLETLALKEAADPVRHDIGAEATRLKELAGWTDEDVAHWVDDEALFAEWRDEFVRAYRADTSLPAPPLAVKARLMEDARRILQEANEAKQREEVAE